MQSLLSKIVKIWNWSLMDGKDSETDSFWYWNFWSLSAINAHRGTFISLSSDSYGIYRHSLSCTPLQEPDNVLFKFALVPLSTTFPRDVLEHKMQIFVQISALDLAQSKHAQCHKTVARTSENHWKQSLYFHWYSKQSRLGSSKFPQCG